MCEEITDIIKQLTDGSLKFTNIMKTLISILLDISYI